MKIWFQNRRTKWKKQENISNAEAAELMKAKGGKANSLPSAATTADLAKLTKSNLELNNGRHSSNSIEQVIAQKSSMK